MAYTPAYAVNGSTDKVLAQVAHNTMRAQLTGSPYNQGKGMKEAWVEITFTSGDVYSSNGVVANLLGQLPGWTHINEVTSPAYYNSNSTAAWEQAVFVAQNDATSTNRLMILQNVAGGETVPIEVANSRVLTNCTIVAHVYGY